jgi:hypothetical protein
MTYFDKAPQEASKFEAKFGLKPLGDDLAARLRRLEQLAGIALEAAIDPGSDSARHTENTTEHVLDEFRTSHEIHARHLYNMLNPDRND